MKFIIFPCLFSLLIGTTFGISRSTDYSELVGTYTHDNNNDVDCINRNIQISASPKSHELYLDGARSGYRFIWKDINQGGKYFYFQSFNEWHYTNSTYNDGILILKSARTMYVKPLPSSAKIQSSLTLSNDNQKLEFALYSPEGALKCYYTRSNI